MIYYSIPWDTGKDIGKYYNSFMNLIGEKDYACFLDGDACFTTTYFGKQIENIVKKYPECGLFTAVTNRLGAKWQMVGNYESNDIKHHRQAGEGLALTLYDEITDISKNDPQWVLSGVLILISKKVWKALGGFKETGMLGVDNDIHWKAQAKGEKVYMMKGVYLYHWYRGGDRDFSKRGHLLKPGEK